MSRATSNLLSALDDANGFTDARKLICKAHCNDGVSSIELAWDRGCAIFGTPANSCHRCTLNGPRWTTDRNGSSADFYIHSLKTVRRNLYTSSATDPLYCTDQMSPLGSELHGKSLLHPRVQHGMRQAWEPRDGCARRNLAIQSYASKTDRGKILETPAGHHDMQY